MRNSVLVGFSALILATSACSAQPPKESGTTPAPQAAPEQLQEAELEGAHYRSGLPFLTREQLAYQAAAKVLTFSVGKACTGEIRKSDDGTKYGIKVFPLLPQEPIVDVIIPVGRLGTLLDADLAKVSKECSL